MSSHKINFKHLFKTTNKIFLAKYVLISVVGYSFIFLSLIILIDCFSLNKSISFLIVYALNYVFLYVVQLKFLFNTNHQNYKLVRFFMYIIVFYVVANLIYNLGIIFGLHYLVSTLLTIGILMPLRLIALKIYVYKDL